MGDDTTNCEGFGKIPPQGGTQVDGNTTFESTGRWMVVYPTGRRNGRCIVTGSGDLRLPPPENSHTVHCDQAHYGPMSGVGAAGGVKGVQLVVV